MLYGVSVLWVSEKTAPLMKLTLDYTQKRNLSNKNPDSDITSFLILPPFRKVCIDLLRPFPIYFPWRVHTFA